MKRLRTCVKLLEISVYCTNYHCESQAQKTFFIIAAENNSKSPEWWASTTWIFLHQLENPPSSTWLWRKAKHSKNKPVRNTCGATSNSKNTNFNWVNLNQNSKRLFLISKLNNLQVYEEAPLREFFQYKMWLFRKDLYVFLPNILSALLGIISKYQTRPKIASNRKYCTHLPAHPHHSKMNWWRFSGRNNSGSATSFTKSN